MEMKELGEEPSERDARRAEVGPWPVDGAAVLGGGRWARVGRPGSGCGRSLDHHSQCGEFQHRCGVL